MEILEPKKEILRNLKTRNFLFNLEDLLNVKKNEIKVQLRSLDPCFTPLCCCFKNYLCINGLAYRRILDFKYK